MVIIPNHLILLEVKLTLIRSLDFKNLTPYEFFPEKIFDHVAKESNKYLYYDS